MRSEGGRLGGPGCHFPSSGSEDTLSLSVMKRGLPHSFKKGEKGRFRPTEGGKPSGEKITNCPKLNETRRRETLCRSLARHLRLRCIRFLCRPRQ